MTESLVAQGKWVESPWAMQRGPLLEALETNEEQGLAVQEVERRQKEFGLNRLKEKKAVSPWVRFFSQFADVMIGLLAAAAGISALIGEWHDSLLIGLIVVANGVIGFLQEQKAEQALEALKAMTKPKAKVWRGGSLTEVTAEQLVPGDVIEISAGNAVPADARLLQAADLQADESPLTGESMPVEKTAKTLAADTPLPERTTMLHLGTNVTQGRGQAVVTRTGMETELGNIATMLESTERMTTPLEARLSKMSKQLSVVVLAVCIVVFIAGVWRAGDAGLSRKVLSEMFLVAVSLAVAAIPEGLPAVISVALALGSQHMARRKAIIRHLAAVETLGSVNVICTDKTGTLTQNKMAVAHLETSNAEGHAQETSPQKTLELLLRSGVLCNDAQWSDEAGGVGSATEAALLQEARDRKVDVVELRRSWPRLKEFPFASDRKRMSTVHRSPDGGCWVFVKGSLESILARSTHIQLDGERQPLSGQASQEIESRLAEMAERGQRILGLAYRNGVDENALPKNDADAEQDLTYLGLVGIVDPVRPEAAEAIRRCRSAGIRVVMITGDHPGTARAVAQELKLMDPDDEVLTGPEMEKLSPAELAERAPRVSVYARVTPAHKLQIIRAHTSHGSVVAMTGDGVNDAPALKQADIGVAMGITGTDVSKEAAKMVLADDNFASIVAAVEEGRVVYENIRKFVRYLLTTNTAEILVLLIAILIDLPLPLLPVHLLWINLVTDGLPALALGFEPAEPGTMQRTPRRRDESLFAGGLVRDILLSGTVMAVGCLVLYYFGLHHKIFDDGTHPDMAAYQESYARTMLFFTLSAAQLFYVLAIRSSERFFFSDGLRALWSNYRLTGAFLIGLAAQLSVTYVPFLHNIFHTTSLSALDLCWSLLVASLAFWFVELHKLVRRLSSHRPA